jgi:hypothetical protein
MTRRWTTFKTWSEGYLRSAPLDPITGSEQSWKLIMEDALSMVNQTKPGIFHVRSGSDRRAWRARDTRSGDARVKMEFDPPPLVHWKS